MIGLSAKDLSLYTQLVPLMAESFFLGKCDSQLCQLVFVAPGRAVPWTSKCGLRGSVSVILGFVSSHVASFYL